MAAERRREEVEDLQSRLTSLAKDGQSWRDDLEEREERVKELEKRMIELETKKSDAAEERARLGEIVEEVAKARRSLQLPKGITITSNGTSLGSVGSSRPETPLSTAPPSEIPQTGLNCLRFNKPTRQPWQICLPLPPSTAMLCGRSTISRPSSRRLTFLKASLPQNPPKEMDIWTLSREALLDL